MSDRAPFPDALDLDHLDRQTGGDRELQREVLELFAEQCERLVPLILGDAPVLQRRDAAHTLKGAARAVGAWAVGFAAEAAEGPLGRGGAVLDDAVAVGLTTAMREALIAAQTPPSPGGRGSTASAGGVG